MKHSCHAIQHRPSIRPGLSGVQPSVRGGFTLVEMMVSIALVMLVMLMFAAIFDVVADTMSAQQGIAKNDQKARTLTILMKEDLEHRTFRRVVPFYPGQDTGTHGPFYSAQERRGYFSISENDPDNNTDDVLAFTARFDVPISGRATLLDNLLVPGGGGYILANQNQPEFDDGFPPQTDIDGVPILFDRGQITNRAGVSRTVEIVYFLRHGNLIRRVMLVREPYDDEGTGSVQPDELTGDYPSVPNPNRHFWRDFDYSAYRDFLNNPGPKFHGTDSMNNDSQTPGTVFVDGKGTGNLDTRVPAVLGVPFFRFGHSPKLRFGIPREFVGRNNNQFIGRFTTQETAHSAFGYPGRNVDPHDLRNPFSLDNSGLVSLFGDERFRRGEDILLSNVHEFDIKVWDDYDEDFNGNGNIDVLYNEPAVDLNNNGILDNITEDINGNNRLDFVQNFVDLGHTLSSNGSPVGYYHRNNVLNTSFSPFNGFRYDTWHPFDNDSDPSNPPPFGFPPFRPLRVYNSDDGVPGTFQDDDRDGFLNDVDRIVGGVLVNSGEQGWLGSDDEVPLKAIQITIRFFDVTSDQMRQLTLIHTLTD